VILLMTWRRCRSFPNHSTGLAPFPRLSAPPHSSHTPIAPRRPGGTSETALYSPPPSSLRRGGPLTVTSGRSPPFPAPPHSTGWQQALAPWRTAPTPPLPHGRQPPLHIAGRRQRVRPSPATHSSPPPQASTAPDCYALLHGTADSPQRQGIFGSASLPSSRVSAPV
uniref:Uncharacterized protein n=1 Tax=Cyprinus carpio carpio TaxID=630221 RepID=A0A9J8B0X5_CYPCA